MAMEDKKKQSTLFFVGEHGYIIYSHGAYHGVPYARAVDHAESMSLESHHSFPM